MRDQSDIANDAEALAARGASRRRKRRWNRRRPAGEIEAERQTAAARRAGLARGAAGGAGQAPRCGRGERPVGDLRRQRSDMWPPLIDALTVAPGYEQALGAAG